MQKGMSKYLVAGAAAGLALYGLYYLTQEVELKHPSIPRERLVELLKSLDTEFTPYLITLAAFSKSIQSRLGTTDVFQVSELIKKNSPIISDISRVESEICLKFNIKPENLEDLCKIEFIQDNEIQNLYSSLKSKLNSAYTGNSPVLSSSLPEKVTPEIVLSIIKDLYEATIYMTYKHTYDIINSGQSLSVNSPEYSKISGKMHEETEKLKEKILISYSFNEFPLPGKTILHQALQTFKSFEWFVESLITLEAEFNQALALVTSRSLPESEVRRFEAKFEERLIWQLDSPREVKEEEVYEYINN